MSLEGNQLLPLLYDPDLAYLESLGHMDFGLQTTMPTIDEIQEARGESEKQSGSELIQSGILDDLHQAISTSTEDYKKITYPNWTDDITLNNMIKKDIQEYYEIRVKQQATDICDFLDGLIQLDRYPQKMFGQYKRLRDFIHATDSKFERVRALNQLRIIGRSIIPPQIRYETPENVESSMVSSSAIREG